jgi:hypothetical protein
LPVETGRWRNCTLPYEDRKCMLCSLNDVGDEFHYLLKCSFFTDERMKYIPRRFYNRANVIKFRELVSAESLAVLNNLSIFLHLITFFFPKYLSLENIIIQSLTHASYACFNPCLFSPLISQADCSFK